MKYLLALLYTASLWASPQEALKRLMQGNDRYVHDKLEHPRRDQDRREAVICTQSPFAVIVGCSDSRVPPEIIFDQGIGDLFVVRVAGNVIGPLELDSIEYATLYLKSVIVLVMGHEQCGAVDAVIQGKTKDIEAVATLIEPAVQEAKKSSPKDLLTASIKQNALRMQRELLKTPIVSKLVKEQKLQIYAAYYDLNSGAVEILNK